jgi:hypothetical protein
MKQAKLQWLQNASEINWGQSEQCKTSDISGIKRGYI